MEFKLKKQNASIAQVSLGCLSTQMNLMTHLEPEDNPETF